MCASCTGVAHELWKTISTSSDNTSNTLTKTPQLKILNMLMTVIDESLNFSIDNSTDLFQVRGPNDRSRAKIVENVLHKVDENTSRLKCYKAELKRPNTSAEKIQHLQKENNLTLDDKEMFLFKE